MAPESTTQSLVERVQGFVSEHRRAILIGTAAAAIAVGGAVYYASTSSPRTLVVDGERRSREKKKGAKPSKKRKTTKDMDGPILEERSPKATSAVDEGQGSTCARTARTLIFGAVCSRRGQVIS
jgi:import receptor subunit TOM70